MARIKRPLKTLPWILLGSPILIGIAALWDHDPDDLGDVIDD